MNTDVVTAAFAEMLALETADRFINAIGDLAISSPIQKIFAAGILYAMQSNRYFGDCLGSNWLFPAGLPGSFDTLNRNHWQPHGSGFLVHCEFPIGKYRSDFFVDCRHYMGGRVMGVIECDGHNFHERTKEQAGHDKARDRYFQSLGLVVLRYTGSEIVRDPLAVAVGALDIFRNLAEGQSERTGT